MTVKQLCLIAIMACINTIVFTTFSSILYLECITFTIVLFAIVFDLKSSVLAAFVFTIVNFMYQGINPWTMIYVVVYPLYSLIVGLNQKFLRKHFFVTVFVCGFLSFLTGQLLQLPMILFSKKITMLYFMLGLQVSIPQGIMSAIFCFICYKPVYSALIQIKRRMNYEKSY